jgi:hypothetical protein
MQCNHTWHALGCRNKNPEHGVTSPLLGSPLPLKGWMVSSFLTYTCLTCGGDLRVLSMLSIIFSIPCVRVNNPHSHGCYWAFAAFSWSTLICSSAVAADVMEPDVLSKVKCLMYLLLLAPSEPSTYELGAVDIWVACDRWCHSGDRWASFFCLNSSWHFL